MKKSSGFVWIMICTSLACQTLAGGTAPPKFAGTTQPAPSERVQTSTPPAITLTPFDPLNGSGKVPRSVLTYEDLMTGTSDGPVVDSAFAIPPDAAPPSFSLQGRIELAGESKEGGFTLLRDDFLYSGDNTWQHLPEMSLEFVQGGSHLIPVDQSLVYTGHVHWNYMIGPGRAWQEVGDQGYSRASFPFTLIERNQNCTHNGVMTFLFNDTSISNVRYQITQETCMYFKFDMWGHVKASFSPSAIANADALIAAHFDWLDNQLPTRPIDALDIEYPDAKINAAILSSGTTPEHTTIFGVYYNGVNYLSGCPTRQGEYPYCASIRLPSYSTAKSALAGLAYMRLAQLYDPKVGDILVGDYLAQGKTGNWDTVTLNHALDMATGHYARPGYMLDEYYGQVSTNFIVAESHQDKLAAAFGFPSKGPPGNLWVYHSTDTYIATQTMYEYLRKQAGGDVDLFDMLAEDIFIPLHFSPGSLSSLRTENSNTGRAFGSHGMFYTPDDIAKLTAFLNIQQGVLNGAQILHPALLAVTMQRDPEDRGIRTTGAEIYNNSFWAKEYRSPCSFYVPFMSGYGGISVAMFPNGATYYAFSDNGEFIFDGAVMELGKLAAMCL